MTGADGGGGPAGRPATSPPRLRLLGPAPSWDGAPLGGRALDLLAALAGGEGARVGDGGLIEALWPDAPPTRPLRALHVVVSRARAAVGEGVVERTGGGYRLALPDAQVDARDLADRAARARRCAAAGRWDRVLELTGALPADLTSIFPFFTSTSSPEIGRAHV